MIRKCLAAMVVAALGVSLMPVTADAGYKPRPGASFNIPSPWGSYAERWRLMHKMDAAIDHTPSGATILVSAFLFDRHLTATKLIRAWRRGVHVRVVLDRDIEASAATRMMHAFNRDNRRVRDLQASWGRDGSFAMKCRGSCRSDRGGSVHTKLYAFSAVCARVQRSRRNKCRRPSARNIVMVSSANPNSGGAARGWNDMYVITNRPRVYTGYRRVHLEMSEDSPRDNDGLIHFRTGPFEHRFYPMRSSNRRTDPIMRDLARVHCRGVAKGYGISGRTAIHISMFWMANTRGEYIARRLLSLAREGCRINLIYGAPSKRVAEMLRGPARSGRIQLWDSRWWFNDDTDVDVRTHHKYVLVNGHLGPDHSARRVWTGSLNWSGANLSWSDDSDLHINRSSAYFAYHHSWSQVRKHSRHIPRPRDRFTKLERTIFN